MHGWPDVFVRHVAVVSGVLTLVSSDNVIVLAATNYVHGIDSAIKRSGRFDRIVNFHLPSQNSREALLRLTITVVL